MLISRPPQPMANAQAFYVRTGRLAMKALFQVCHGQLEKNLATHGEPN